MSRLHEKLRDVQHLIKGGPRNPNQYQLSQVSVEYLVTALNSHAEPPESPETMLQTGEIEDVNCCRTVCIVYIYILTLYSVSSLMFYE